MTDQAHSPGPQPEQERRRLSVQNALTSSRLSGGHPTATTVANLEAYIEGRVSIDELVQAAIERAKQKG